MVLSKTMIGKLFFIVLVFFMVFSFTSFDFAEVDESRSEEIVPDLELRMAINMKLGIDDYEASISIEQLESLTGKLFINNGHLVSLKGLEYATNLTEISLNDNEVVDLTPLQGLTNLTKLNIYDNNVSDITPLSGLTNLTNLQLEKNNVSDLSPLSGLLNINYLNLRENQIYDLSPLSTLTNLEGLILHGNKVRDLTPLSGLTNLKLLNLNINKITDVSPLSGLTNLEALYFDLNDVSDISSLSNLVKLQYIEFSVNHISDISIISNFNDISFDHYFQQRITRVLSAPYEFNSMVKHKDGSTVSLTLKDEGVVKNGSKYTLVAGESNLEWVAPSFAAFSGEIRVIRDTEIQKDVKALYLTANQNISFRDNVWGNVIGVIPSGATLNVSGQLTDFNNRTWYRVSYNGNVGFIRNKNVSKVNKNIIVTDKTQVRKSPGGEPVGNLYRNTIKTVYGYKLDAQGKKWYKIWYKGNYKYISSLCTDWYLNKELNYYIRLNNTMNLRDGVGGDIVGVLQAGTVKTVYGKRKDSDGNLWYRIWYNNGPAYVNGAYVTKLDYYVRVTDKIKVRKSPWGSSVGYLYKNKIKTAYGYNNDSNGIKWYKIWYNGNYRYIYKLHTDRNLSSVPNFKVKLNYNLTVRNGVWGAKRGVINKNGIWTVYGQRKDRNGETWYRIWYNGAPGYIRAKYTTKQ